MVPMNFMPPLICLVYVRGDFDFRGIDYYKMRVLTEVVTGG